MLALRSNAKTISRILSGAALWAALFSFGAQADELGTEPLDCERSEDTEGVWSLTSENDLFGGTDRNYSNGLRIERVRPENCITPGLAWVARRLPLLDLDRTDLRQGFALSHAIFTPEDISRVEPDPDDRPYAGWLYVSATAVATTPLDNDGAVQDVLQVNLGVVGPSAGGEFVQREWHALIDEVDPKGWDSQLRDEPGLEIIAQRMRKFKGSDGLLLGLKTDYALHGGAALGNVRTYAALGGTARLGWDLDADFGPPRIRPALAGAGVFDPERPFGGYIFAGIEGRAVARDIFLDGNSFRDSPSVNQRRPFVADAQMGFAIHNGTVQVAFTYVHRTEEFVEQAGPQRFGAVSISIAR
ncbi:MAG: lipid A deacylase LpxR family protein [Pseudomonadota bacterium]